MGRTGQSSRSAMDKVMKKLCGSAKDQKEKIYLRGKEELTHTQAGKPRWDAGFFKSALKEKAYRGNKY